MSICEDFIFFVNGFSPVRYFDQGVKYYPKPTRYLEFYEYQLIHFYKTSSGCFVGVGFSQFVRKISVKEFEEVKTLYYDRLKRNENLKKRIQTSLF